MAAVSMRRSAKSLVTAAWLLRNPTFQRPGHYYSPLTGAEDVERAERLRANMHAMDGIRLHADDQLALARDLAPSWSELGRSSSRYRADNSMFGGADGAVYYSLLKHLRPSRVIEVGSGFSSAIALDLREREMPSMNLTFIEPFPARLLGLLRPGERERIDLVAEPVQNAPLALFEELGAGDILFIDSTHVSKAGSDVNWLFFQILPRLEPGVVVHVHDVFDGFEYPADWIREGRSWNEDYLLRAFLAYNDTFDIMLFNSWLWKNQPSLIEEHLPAARADRPGSIWLRKTK